MADEKVIMACSGVFSDDPAPVRTLLTVCCINVGKVPQNAGTQPVREGLPNIVVRSLKIAVSNPSRIRMEPSLPTSASDACN